MLNSKDNKNYVLEFKNVTKSYDSSQKQIVALKEINLGVEDGSFTCIVGPSGCGKTTMLTLVAGLNTPSQGSVELNGQVHNHLLQKSFPIGHYRNYWSL